EVNKTILSRSRVFELKPLDPDDLKAVAAQALGDPARGYGSRKVEIAPDALNHLARVANGDARALLNALELAVETTPPDEHQTVRVTLEVAEESIQRKAVLYDKEGDAHFDTISAFIKSLRGSDPDAALYWMARMVYGGEEPRFIFRRMIIFAGEDVGLADPAALPMVMAAAQAFDYVGMPEGRFHLAEACLYLALAPKSNSLFGFWDALEAVEKDRAGDVPSHLKDASRDGPGLGHGQGYQYPHAYRDHWVAQQYLPDVLQGRVFYEPGEQGFEAGLKTRVLQLREAQLAAGQEGALGLLGPLDGPSLWAEQSAPAGAGARRESEFLRRGETALGGHLAAVREAMFALAGVERGHLVLDANAGSGLLVWEAVRRAAEGGVWCLASTPAEAAALEQQAQKLDTLAAPVVLCGELNQLEPLMEARQEGRVIFDRILVRNLAGRLLPAPASGGPTGLDGAEKFRLGAERLARVLAMGGCLVWGEPVPRLGQPPLAALLADDILPGVPPHLKQVLLAAEDSLYHDSSDPLVNWDAEELAEGVERAGLRVVRREALVREVMLPVDRGLLDRWFGRTSQDGGRLSQAILANHPGEEGFSLAADGRRLLESWLGRTIRRRTVVALLKAQK
ncbi:MAG: AAA family ATPase, partial [Deltaproteobacteria bacterium]|nr:AAA family ATPase [Deltaproteobacteria bacterium]